ncbi:cytochrome P450 [Mycena floridula]|nr:cytochrome P450 [Mycena floridula]
MTLWKYVGAAVVIFIAHKFFQFRQNARKFSYLPGMRCLFSPASPFGSLIPTFFLNPGLGWQWKWRNQVYSKYGVETMSVIPYLAGRPTIYTSSLEVARQMVSMKGQFHKENETSQIVLLWGRNMFAENGSDWRRHHRIMTPAFSPPTYKLVWEQTSGLYDEMIQAEDWCNKSEVVVPSMQEMVSKLALIVISRCGFGHPIAWTADSSSGTMSFKDALETVSGSSIARLVVPRWMYYLPIARLHEIDKAYNLLAAFMQNLIKARREELLAGVTDNKQVLGKDVFRLMIRASEDEGELRMTDDELTGNTFIMLFAGHETTAKTMNVAIGFLALYEDVQEDIYQQVKNVVSEDGKLSYSDYSRLDKVRASFVEAARMFPAAFMMIRETVETVTLRTDLQDGHGGQIVLDPGTRVIVDLVSLHYNPRYFPDPEEFRPSRWYGASESTMTMFSMGSRTCIGRRFALTEGVSFLSHLLRDWKLHIILNPSETRTQWRQRVMKGISLMTLGVDSFPIRLTRR